MGGAAPGIVRLRAAVGRSGGVGYMGPDKTRFTGHSRGSPLHVDD